MYLLRIRVLKSSLFYSFCVLTLFSVFLVVGAEFNQTEAKVTKKNSNSVGNGTTFPGTGTGVIPDNACGTTNLTITFAVSGLSGTASNIDVDMMFNPAHTFVGDLDMELVSPDGTRHWIQSFTGGQDPAVDFGDGSDVMGPYTFSDTATANWWATAANPVNATIPSGSYRTQAPGPSATDDPGPAFTNMTAAFSAIPDLNGNWSLVIGDCAAGDTGGIASANLSITAGTTAVSNPNVDFDGDGKSDYAIVRDETTSALRSNGKTMMSAKSYRERIKLQADIEKSGLSKSVTVGTPGTNLGWYISNSGDSSFSIKGHGEPLTDSFVPADFDGDEKDDIAVWRPVGPGGAPSGNGFFHILNSSNNTLTEIDFGQNLDDSTVTGDYDGDGKADPAVLRCPSGAAGQCTYFYKGSAGGGEITFVPWGFGSIFSIFANPGDFDGDGKYDFCIQRTHPASMLGGPGPGQFVLLRSSDLGVEYVNFGLNTDNIAPGDYNGDGRADYAVVRSDLGQLTWYILDSSGSGTLGEVPFGLTASDFITPGDYDGDGKADIAVWRQGINDNDNIFFVFRSSDQSVSAFEWGNPSDLPVANWTVH